MKHLVLALCVATCPVMAQTNNVNVIATTNSLIIFDGRTNLTVDGVIYSNVVFTGVTPTDVSIRHSTGATTIPLDRLPSELKKQFGYDPQNTARQREAIEPQNAAQPSEATTQQITGAFGVTLGTRVDVSQYTAVGSMDDGTPVYSFTPSEPLAGMTRYYFLATPKTGLIYRIWARQIFDDDG